jgi:hypothetical protein
MAISAQRTDPALWERIKAEVLRGDRGGDPGRWSARKAQFAVQEYKRRGGGYVGPKRADNSLVRWTEAHDRPQRDYPSRSDLLDEACHRAIPGRWHMTKEELRRALRSYS